MGTNEEQFKHQNIDWCKCGNGYQLVEDNAILLPVNTPKNRSGHHFIFHSWQHVQTNQYI
jgi:predicted carbohydrate-binding protein with CBM5 and CBM33 domain